MSCYQLIKTIKMSTKVKVLFEEELLKVILNIITKIWRIACRMAVKFFSRQSPETKLSQFYKVSLLNWLP